MESQKKGRVEQKNAGVLTKNSFLESLFSLKGVGGHGLLLCRRGKLQMSRCIAAHQSSNGNRKD